MPEPKFSGSIFSSVGGGNFGVCLSEREREREKSIVCGSKSGAADDDDDDDGDGDANAAIDSIPNDDWSFRSSIRGRGDLYVLYSTYHQRQL